MLNIFALNLWKFLDLSNVSFDGIDVGEVDFIGSRGATMNIDEAIKTKEVGTNLTDVTIIDKDKYETIADNIVKAFQKQLVK